MFEATLIHLEWWGKKMCWGSRRWIDYCSTQQRAPRDHITPLFSQWRTINVIFFCFDRSKSSFFQRLFSKGYINCWKMKEKSVSQSVESFCSVLMNTWTVFSLFGSQQQEKRITKSERNEEKNSVLGAKETNWQKVVRICCFGVSNEI